jgi:hypothetical protein
MQQSILFQCRQFMDNVHYPAVAGADRGLDEPRRRRGCPRRFTSAPLRGGGADPGSVTRYAFAPRGPLNAPRCRLAAVAGGVEAGVAAR